MLFYIAISAGSLAIVSALIVGLRPLAMRFGLVDKPDHRKLHGEEVPLVGGMALFGAYLAVYQLFDIELQHFLAFVAAASLLIGVGVLDDRVGLKPKHRFAAQGVAALCMVYGANLSLENLGDLFGFGVVHLGWTDLPFTVFCVVGLINAFNMADGVDGLAGSMGLVAAATFAAAAALSGFDDRALATLGLCGALLGFLVFNFRHPLRPFRVFMGDAGSMFLGLTLVWIAIAVTQRPGATLYPIAAVWILGVPILDTVATMLRRAAAGRNPFQPDRSHLHHLFLSLGFSPTRTVLVMAGASAVFAGVGFAGWRFGVAEPVLTYGFLVVAVLYYVAVTLAWDLVSRTHLGSVSSHVDPAITAANQSTAPVRSGLRRRVLRS